MRNSKIIYLYENNKISSKFGLNLPTYKYIMDISSYFIDQGNVIHY